MRWKCYCLLHALWTAVIKYRLNAVTTLSTINIHIRKKCIHLYRIAETIHFTIPCKFYYFERKSWYKHAIAITQTKILRANQIFKVRKMYYFPKYAIKKINKLYYQTRDSLVFSVIIKANQLFKICKMYYFPKFLIKK